MVDWSREIFKNDNIGSRTGANATEIDWSREAFRDDTELKQAPVTQPKPEMRFGEEQLPASWATHAKAAWVQDPNVKMGIYANSRGIDPKRYGQDQYGFYYIGKDGVPYREPPPSATTAITTGIASRPISTAGGITGAVISPGGIASAALAGLMTAGGRGIERSIAHMVWGDPLPLSDTLKDLGKELMVGAFGEKVGQTFIRGIDLTHGKEAAKLMRYAGRGRSRMSRTDVMEMKGLSKKFGIDLFSPQLTGSRELAGRFNLLADLMETADRIGEASIKQYEQVAASIDNYLTSIGPYQTPAEAGKKIKEISEKAVQGLKAQRRAPSAELYKQAEQVAGVDISSTMVKINDLLEEVPRGGTSYKGINKLKKMLERKVVGPKGEQLIPEDRVKVLDQVKKEVNASWKQDPTSAPVAKMQAQANNLLDDMLNQIDEVTPAYKEARKIFRGEVPKYDKWLGKGRKLKEIAKLQGDSLEKAAFNLFSPTQSSVSIVNNIRPIIIKYGGKDAWDSLVRTYYENVLDSIKTPVNASNATNLGGRFRQALYGYPKQRKILKAAQPDKFKNLEDFSKLLDRLGIIITKESRTTPAGAMLATMKKEAGRGILSPLRVMAHPMVSPARPFYEKLVDIRFTYNANKLADLMLSEDAINQLHKVLALRPRSAAFIKGSSSLLSQIGGRIYLDEEPERKNIQPQISPF